MKCNVNFSKKFLMTLLAGCWNTALDAKPLLGGTMCLLNFSAT